MKWDKYYGFLFPIPLLQSCLSRMFATDETLSFDAHPFEEMKRNEVGNKTVTAGKSPLALVLQSENTSP